MDAMSDAIEGADVMLYGVSLRYKESANVSGSRCHGLEAERAAADPESRSCMIGWHLSRAYVLQCRLEANYAHQQELDMIPLMMQKDYKPQGWRKHEPTALRVV